jgi:hypothetical protein
VTAAAIGCLISCAREAVNSPIVLTLFMCASSAWACAVVRVLDPRACALSRRSRTSCLLIIRLLQQPPIGCG